MTVESGEARHRIANVLHTYVATADRKDVDAVVELVGAADFQFHTAWSEDTEGVRERAQSVTGTMSAT